MPSPSTTTPQTAPAAALRLVVRGFNAMERSLLDGTVRLSQRRTPRLEVLPLERALDADVVMIDARDAAAVEWARATPQLKRMPVIWVDGHNVPPGHTEAKRPVQWPILPMLLARALENGPAARAGERRAQEAAASGVAPPVSASGKPRVLVVDDSLAVRAHTRSMVEAQGYKVYESVSGDAALQQVAPGRFACVLMDVLMPGMDGYEACKRIKAQARTVGRVPVVMLTSRGSPFDRIRGKMAGCDGYLTKPVEADELSETLRRFAPIPDNLPVLTDAPHSTLNMPLLPLTS